MLNKDYQKFGKASFDRALRHLSSNADLLPETFRSLWEVYENFLNGAGLRNTAPDARNTIRERNRIFASFLTERAIDAVFIDTLFQIKETYELAQLQPRIYHEETFQLRGRKDTSAHDAFSSDFARYLSSGKCKEPIPRLLDLQYVVRCNLDHGQKVLPDEWPAMKERNESIFKLTVPIQKRLAELLFENLWADGVFVYGTCKPDEGNFVYLSLLVHEYSDGWHVEGYLYDLGSYPGFVEKLGYRTKGFVLNSTVVIWLVIEVVGGDL
jgi:hypothetical protein